MRYEMGPVELIGWVILGGWLGFVIGSLIAVAIGPPDLGTGLLIFVGSIAIGAAVPIGVYCRGRQRW